MVEFRIHIAKKSNHNSDPNIDNGITQTFTNTDPNSTTITN